MSENVQGELFAEFAPKPIEKPVKVVSTPKREKETASIAPKVDISRYPKPKDFYTYDEFLKRYCGDHTLAEYWWKKQMERREETKRICQ